MRTDSALRLLSILAITVLAALACNSSGGASGETHFICSATPDCLQHGADLVCIGGVCTEAASTNDRRSKPNGFAADITFDAAFVTEVDLGVCVPRQLFTVSDSRTGEPIVPCAMVEVRSGSAEGCDRARGRAVPPPSLVAAVNEHLNCNVAGGRDCNGMVLCDIREASDSCHHEGPAAEVGWCYVDPNVNENDDASGGQGSHYGTQPGNAAACFTHFSICASSKSSSWMST